jgi:Matrixin
MTWQRLRTLLRCLSGALWLTPVIASAFVYTAQRGNDVVQDQTSGTPAIWEDRRVTMSLNLGRPGRVLLNDTTSWDDNAEAALDVWNTVMQSVQDPFFTFNTTEHDPCDEKDGFNTVAWESDHCGDGFGDAVAITQQIFRSDASGRFFMVNADVLFNSTLSWDAYTGPLQYLANDTLLFDLRRVALHEFGHVLGLGHPDEGGQRVAAIMNSHSERESLTQDDIDGALFIYSDAAVANDGSSGGGGCTINPRAGFDLMLAGLTGLILVFLSWRYARQRR